MEPLTKTLAIVGCLLAVGGGYYWATMARGTGTSPESDRPQDRRPTDDSTPPRAEPPAAKLPVATQTPPAAPLRFPDGSTAAPLNGVTAPAPMTWGPHAWSPIAGTTWSEGVEWYVHEDGTQTTTIELWRTDLGRFDSVTVVVHSGEPSPIDTLGPIRGRRR